VHVLILYCSQVFLFRQVSDTVFKKLLSRTFLSDGGMQFELDVSAKTKTFVCWVMFYFLLLIDNRYLV
jgi:hypothetical protein